MGTNEKLIARNHCIGILNIEKITSKGLKVGIYKSVLRTIVTYGSENSYLSWDWDREQ